MKTGLEKLIESEFVDSTEARISLGCSGELTEAILHALLCAECLVFEPEGDGSGDLSDLKKALVSLQKIEKKQKIGRS